MNQLTVRKILPDDWQACWDIQRSLHTEMEEHLWSADLWVFICGTLTDSFVVCDENDTPIGYWIGVLQVNPNEETPDIWCLAIDVCTHRDHRESGVMDLIMPVATSYHPRIFAFTQKGNTAAEGIMTKWGFTKGEYYPKTNNHYWSVDNT
jgi:hypothetical protein